MIVYFSNRELHWIAQNPTEHAYLQQFPHFIKSIEVVEVKSREDLPRLEALTDPEAFYGAIPQPMGSCPCGAIHPDGRSKADPTIPSGGTEAGS